MLYNVYSEPLQNVIDDFFKRIKKAIVIRVQVCYYIGVRQRSKGSERKGM